MTFEEFSKIFEVLYKERQVQDEFFDSLPSSINSAFCDNDFVTSMITERNMLLANLFSEDIIYDIDYFLYEWQEGFLRRLNGAIQKQSGAPH